MGFVLQACTTFNFLNAESRMVAGAFIPPKVMSLRGDDGDEKFKNENAYQVPENAFRLV